MSTHSPPPLDVLDIVTKVDVKPRLCQRFPTENRASGSLPAGIEHVREDIAILLSLSLSLSHHSLPSSPSLPLSPSFIVYPFLPLSISFVVHKDGVSLVIHLLPPLTISSSPVNWAAICTVAPSTSISRASRWPPGASSESSKREGAH